MHKPEIIKLENSNVNERFVRWSFEKFILKYPEVKVECIFKKNNYFYIYCPNINEEIVSEGKSIFKLFESNVREIFSPIELTNIFMDDAEEIKIEDFVRSKDDVIMNYGEPGSLRDLYYELSLVLDKSFPKFYLKTKDKGGGIIICFERILNNDEISILTDKLNDFKIPIPSFELNVDKNIKYNAPPFRNNFGHGDLLLLPSRSISDNYSSKLKHLYEEDEDFWIDNKRKLMGNFETNKLDYLPSKFLPKKSSCILQVQSTPQSNIRNYLSIYNIIYLVAPVYRNHHYLNSLGITENELKELIEIDRVKLLLPHSVDMYDASFLNIISDSKPDNILFSRRLASATICDARQRIPFLFPPLSVLERSLVLRGLYEFISFLSNDNEKEFFYLFVKQIEDIWSTTELQVHERGAMGTTLIGLGQIMGPIINKITGKDLLLECMFASQSVEWAGALNSIVIPYETKTYSEQGMVETLASFYSGVKKSGTPKFFSNVNFTIEEILAIDKEVPVVDFAKSFGSNDIDRFRELIFKLIQNQNTNEDIREAVRNFNNEIIKYERRSEYYSRWEIKGWVYFATGMLMKEIGLTGLAIPMGKWLLSLLTKKIDRNMRTSNPYVGGLFDTLKGMVTASLPCAILVSRLRKNLTK